ncbi:hypothetical protein ACP3T3_02965 [Chryseobacterium sp. CBSDS_008]|uniref:hypothetical protein n=1 Tax=Chryseobacterium sp. CBSDS_008 TaxID=3415265 RepID=UPI003CF9BE22
MKKLILLAAFGVAGLVSAENLVVKETTIKEKSKKEAEAPKKETTKAQTTAACVPVSYSCGVSGWACGATVMEMLSNAWDGDSLFCGN